MAKGSKPSLNGQRSYMSGVKQEAAVRDGIKQATEAERDRIVALIEHATEAWVEETPGSEGWAAYVTALNAARRNVEEALRIIDDADRT